MKKIAIVGFGRFGKTLYRLLKNDFNISTYQRNEEIAEIYKNEVIFYCVPISSFEKVISEHQKYFKDTHLLIDVLSVKEYPAKVFRKYLGDRKTQAILTHPMFGPDSSKDGFTGLPIIIDRFMSEDKNYKFWKTYWQSKNLKVIEISPKQHDLLAANSQGLTHFIGRLLDEFKLEKTDIDSLGVKKLLEIKEQTCNDTWQLFEDLQHYNAYTKQMRLKLGRTYEKLYNRLLPKRIDSRYLIYGIQGGRGSFNEEAILYNLHTAGVSNYKIEYLYTSEKVLAALHQGKIDIGQFAIHNSVGGIVEESIEAMAKYKFKIEKQFSIKISHALMIHRDANLAQIDRIMSHPQVFAQCKDTLAQKYPNLKLISGLGNLIDHAVVAKYLSQNKLDKNIATMGSKVLAKIYGLKIVEDNLQDAEDNYTGFLQVSR